MGLPPAWMLDTIQNLRMAMQQTSMEIELKFGIPAERLKAVEAALRRGAVVRTRLQARYFDTADGALAAQGMVLRLRKEGRRWVQTLKARGDGLVQREEHNVDLGVARAGAVPQADPQRHQGTPAGERLIALLAKSAAPLAARYGTDIWRLTRQLRSNGSTVELALDLGHVVAHPDTPQARTSPVQELELELLRGPVSGLIALAQRWAQQHGLWLSTLTKAERGQRLLASETTPAPAVRAQPPQFGDDDPPDGAAVQRVVLGNCLQQILPNASEIAAGSSDDEQIHQLRVGLRRLRVALRELAALNPPAFADAAAWEPPLVDAFQALGVLRDRAQLLERMTPRLREAGAPPIELPPASDSDTPSPGEAARHPALQQVLLTLIGMAAGSAPPDAADAATAATPEAAAAPAATVLDAKATRKLLRKRLQALHAKTLRDGKAFETLAAEQQHTARKRLKRLRYLAEFVAPLLDPQGDAANRYLKRLGPAQDALGAFNDDAVACAVYRDAAPQCPTAWFAVGWLGALQPASARACRKALVRVGRAKGFWGGKGKG